MASRPDGDVWNIVENDKDSQHYGRNFKFDFSYISSEEIKDVVKDYVWQNYRVGNKSLSTLYGEVHTCFFQFIMFADTINITSLKGLTNTDVVLSFKLDAPSPCRLDAPDLDLICYASADCLHQHLQVI